MHDEAWLTKTEEELLLEIGRPEGQFNAMPQSPQQLNKNATKWLEKWLPTILDRICADTESRNRAHAEEKELLFHALAEAAVHLALHVPAGCVAAYLIKKGVRHLCQDRWAKLRDSDPAAESRSDT